MLELTREDIVDELVTIYTSPGVLGGIAGGLVVAFMMKDVLAAVAAVAVVTVLDIAVRSYL